MPPPGPEPVPQVPPLIRDLGWAFARTRVFQTAIQLGLFARLAAGPRTPAALADEAGWSRRGTRMLLEALAALGLLERRDRRFALTADARRFLVPDSPNYLGHAFEDDRRWRAWSELPECVRGGRPTARGGAERDPGAFFAPLVRSLHVTHAAAAAAAARVLTAGRRPGARILDLACGSGVWGIALARADPAARVTAQDFASVLELTRGFVAEAGLTDRFSWLPGDLDQFDPGEASFDLVLLGHIVHSLGARRFRALLPRLHRALVPGGRLAIADMVPDDDRTGPPFPLLFALNMLVHTEEGDVFSRAEYAEMLAEAGFGPPAAHDLGSHSPLLVAERG
ncbi:MAG: methyltransferase domain-containing protein [Planctomycetota bacterium]|nr:MAG: methyltransferase domain-containing protein [Planctomycetota bacterium]